MSTSTIRYRNTNYYCTSFNLVAIYMNAIYTHSLTSRSSLLSCANGSWQWYSVTVSSGFNPLSVGSVAIYSCDTGYALLGTITRNCADPDSDSVGTWTGAMLSIRMSQTVHKVVKIEACSNFRPCFGVPPYPNV